MAQIPETTYRQEYARYRYYFHHIISFYQKPAAKVSTALLLTITTIVFFAVFAIRPTLVTIAELLKKIEDQKVLVEKLKQKASALATAQHEYSLHQPDLAILARTVPKESDAQAVISLLEGMAAEQGLPYSNFSLIEPIIFSSVEVPQTAGEKSLQLGLTIQGPYNQLVGFLDKMHSAIRLVGISGISLNPATQGNQTDENSLTLTMSAHIYYLPQITEVQE